MVCRDELSATAVDGNFWWSGLTSLSGIQRLATKQAGSRIGGTFAWRFAKHRSLKFSYSEGTYSKFGGNYQNVAVAAGVAKNKEIEAS